MKRKNISKSIVSIIYCVVIFFVALFCISTIMNQGNTDMTAEMGNATFPVVTFYYDNYDLDCLHGYSQPMDEAFLRESLTPLKEDRKVNFRIDTYNSVISEISYELRTADGQRLIEAGDIFGYIQIGNVITADIALKDLMDKDKEYSLCIILSTPEEPEIRYYTRVFDATGLDPASMLYFAYNFSNKTFSKADAQAELTTYLESNRQGDNTTFHKVDIHSSFNQVTWGNLNVTKVTPTKATILDLNEQVGMIELNYMVMIPENENEIYYRVKEYFRMRKGSERMYLLEYERTMDQIFDNETGTIANNKFVLGITNENVNLVESEDGSRIAFASEGRLYSYNITDNKLSDIFNFYSADMTDLRTTYDHNDIRIFSIDETGNVQFMVYGYMNRGEHEGKMGIVLYYYNSVLNTVEEQLFIPYDRSFEMLKYNMDQIAYVNATNKCYIYLDGNLYEFNLLENKYQILAENIYEERFLSSQDQRLVAYVNDPDSAEQIEMINLLNGRKVLISCEKDELLRPIGFFGSDLIYGVARKSDLRTDLQGKTIFPMYKVVICTEGNQIIKEYEEDGFYTVDAVVTGNMVTLNRATKDEVGNFIEAVPDQILNNSPTDTMRNKVETVVTDTYETIVQIAVKNEINRSQMQILNPRFVLHEGGSEAHINTGTPNNYLSEDYPDNSETIDGDITDGNNIADNISSNPNYFYTYIRGNLVQFSQSVADEILLAYENNGIVLDSQGQVVFHKTILPNKNQIMAIGGTKIGEEEGTSAQKAVCINTILTYNGITEDTRNRVARGESAESILSDLMPDAEILNLSGCPLEVALSYVARDIPVLVEMTDGSAVVLVGFNEYNTVIMDPVRGEVYKVGINDSTEWFAKNGNRFLTYR